MLLRNSISKTKNFFQRTIQSFKSFMSNDNYHKLPKTPPFNPFSCNNRCRRRRRRSTSYDMNYKELDKLYTDHFTTNQWDAADSEKNATIKKITSPTATKQDRKQEEEEEEEKYSSLMREKRTNLVAEKLKEMAMVDVGNMEHVLDIEEVLHYYSRLTCPAYLDIVDKFFMEMHSEFFGPMASSTPGTTTSCPRSSYR